MPKKSFLPETEQMLRDLGFAVAEYVRKKNKAKGSKGQKGGKPTKTPNDIEVPACLLIADGDYCREPIPWPLPGPKSFAVRFKAGALPTLDPRGVKRPTK